jgi:hypothetical protein
MVPRRLADAKVGLGIIAEFGLKGTKIGEQQFYMLAAVAGLFSFLEMCKTEFGRLSSIQFITIPNNSCMYISKLLY